MDFEGRVSATRGRGELLGRVPRLVWGGCSLRSGLLFGGPLLGTRGAHALGVGRGKLQIVQESVDVGHGPLRLGCAGGPCGIPCSANVGGVARVGEVGEVHVEVGMGWE